MRHPSLGVDRHGTEFFHFPSLQGKLFLRSKSKKWTVLSKMSEYDAVVSALDERGIKEQALLGKLRGRAYMTDDVLDEKKLQEVSVAILLGSWERGHFARYMAAESNPDFTTLVAD